MDPRREEAQNEDRNQTSVNPPLPPPRQDQLDDNLDQAPLHVVIREIANAFRNAIVGAAVTARPAARKTNLICVRPQYNNNYNVYCPNNNNNNSRVTCYTCSEPGHISWKCMSERVPVRSMSTSNQNPNPNPPQALNSHHRNNEIRTTARIVLQPCNVNLCDLDDLSEEDAFVTLSAQHQPYSTQRPCRNLKKSESKAEERLRVTVPDTDAPVVTPLDTLSPRVPETVPA
ncbi:24055_t:CDS:2 [Gigaspora margarita]|uniref:24055_t:CDS:1 n=1 Tax=Gigaspora margarita TaxID=4874 RepID=A0ABN7VHL3_GIGMA|nr:24055_t:CDS:2 [Gigaspora margarita]